MTKCTTCQAEFQIYPEDRVFYQKFDVADPTQCPTCRSAERLLWRNERTLYPGACGLCKKPIITVYSPRVPFPVYCNACWWSDAWNPIAYGREYQNGQSFFNQFRALSDVFPRTALESQDVVNSEYTNYSTQAKDCYLSTGLARTELVFYSNWITGGRELVDCSVVYDSELAIECVDVNKLYRVFWGQDLDQCADCSYLYNSRNCTNCFLCAGLNNKQYYFENQACSKDEYERKVTEARRQSHEELIRRFETIKQRAIRKFTHLQRNENCSGDYIYVSKDCFQSYDIAGCENLRYGTSAKPPAKDCMDVDYCGLGTELSFSGMSFGSGSRNAFGVALWWSTNVRYSMNCKNSENLFGCVGLRKQKYCILNKPYEPKEYAAITARIKEDMKQSGEWGKFFPARLCPFGYNETVAQTFYPLARDQALARGFFWTDQMPGKRGDPALPTCASCGNNFTVIKQEEAIYQKLGAPLPTACPTCRYYARMALRNPRQLWHRRCMCNMGGQKLEVGYQNTTTHLHGSGRCPNEFETTYSPERTEMIYCEQCYQNEVF